LEIVIIAAAVSVALVLAALAFWWLRRRRPRATDVRRDAPTLAPPARIEGGLARTRRALGERLDGLRGRGLDTAFWTGLEEALLEADVGVAASVGIVERVRAAAPGDPAADAPGIGPQPDDHGAATGRQTADPGPDRHGGAP